MDLRAFAGGLLWLTACGASVPVDPPAPADPPCPEGQAEFGETRCVSVEPRRVRADLGARLRGAVRVGDRLVFRATRPRTALFGTDGTPGGTVPLEGFDPQSFRPVGALDGGLVFVAEDTARGDLAMWATDGQTVRRLSETGTILEETFPFGGEVPEIRIDGRLAWPVRFGRPQAQLLLTDGTALGTEVFDEIVGVRDARRLPDGAVAIAALDGLWLVEPDGRHWRLTEGRFDAVWGQIGGLVVAIQDEDLVVTPRTGGEGLALARDPRLLNAPVLAVAARSLYFNLPQAPRVVFRSDGTVDGTAVVYTAPDGSTLDLVGTVGDRVLLVRTAEDATRSLVSVGPEGADALLEALGTAPLRLRRAGEQVLLVREDDFRLDQAAAWTTDGTPQGTRAVCAWPVSCQSWLSWQDSFHVVSKEWDTRADPVWLERLEGTPLARTPRLRGLDWAGAPVREVSPLGLSYGDEARLFAAVALEGAPFALFETDGTVEGTTTAGALPDAAGVDVDEPAVAVSYGVFFVAVSGELWLWPR